MLRVIGFIRAKYWQDANFLSNFINKTLSNELKDEEKQEINARLSQIKKPLDSDKEFTALSEEDQIKSIDKTIEEIQKYQKNNFKEYYNLKSFPLITKYAFSRKNQSIYSVEYVEKILGNVFDTKEKEQDTVEKIFATRNKAQLSSLKLIQLKTPNVITQTIQSLKKQDSGTTELTKKQIGHLQSLEKQKNLSEKRIKEEIIKNIRTSYSLITPEI